MNVNMEEYYLLVTGDFNYILMKRETDYVGLMFDMFRMLNLEL